MTNPLRAPAPSAPAASVRLSHEEVERVPAVLHITAASARVTVDDQPAGLIDVQDPGIWVSIDHWLIDLGEVLVATVPLTDERILYTTLDGAYQVARLGVRLFCKGDQIDPWAEL